jgi:drug/metabolite transporter (DMT)-like permease
LGLQTAAQAQLLVPVLATLMGIVFLAEHISLIMILASGLILMGITTAIRAKEK